MKVTKRIVRNVIVITLAIVACITIVMNVFWPDIKQSYYANHPEYCRRVARLNSHVRVFLTGGKYFVYNSAMKRPTICGMSNFYQSSRPDSIPVWYSKGGCRGFFNPKTGEPLIDDKTYTHAWVFSEGLAAVEKNGLVGFIDLQGHVAIDQVFHFDPTIYDYCFRNGYCIMPDSTGRRGLIDHDGKWAVLPQYDRMIYANDSCWVVWKQGKKGVLNSSLRQVLPCAYTELAISKDNGVTVTMPDGSMRQYSYNGNIISRNVFTDVNVLRFTGPEPIQSYDETMYVADCMSYECGDERVGLLTMDYRPVTSPIYRSIEALARNRFLCTMENGASLILDEHGKPLQH